MPDIAQISSSPSFSFNFDLFFWIAGSVARTINVVETIMNAADSGRLRKVVGSPWDMRSDNRRLLSIIGPRTRARINGGISNLYFSIR